MNFTRNRKEASSILSLLQVCTLAHWMKFGLLSPFLKVAAKEMASVL